MNDTIAWIALVTAILGFITKLVEFAITSSKSKAADPSALTPEKPVMKEVSHSPETASTISAITKKIYWQWNKVTAFCGVAFVVYVMTQAYALLPDTSDTMQTVSTIGGMLLAFAYLGIAFVEARRAVRLHEAKARLEVIEIIPEALVRWVAIQKEKRKQMP